MRPDIQMLRGYAVLLVLLYHAWPERLRAGYLGVDIFFVISGYLITKTVAEGIAAGTFRFREFYTRRVRRLLPACYTVLLITALLSVWLLTESELADFVAQMAGAVTMSANIVLWKQTGYFAGPAEGKPLLHLWSLAIEEQYYALLPISLLLVPRRWWAGGGWLVFAGSLGLCWYRADGNPNSTFYLLPTRAWELAIGSIGALSLRHWRSGVFYWPALAVLAVIPFAPAGGGHPGLDALLVCAATLVALLRSGEPVRVPAVLCWFGDISYSLYLVHWPVFVFVRAVWMGPTSNLMPLALLAVSVTLGYALYRFVERPVRASTVTLSPRVLGGIVLASAVLVAIPAVRLRSGERPVAREPNYGLGEECEYKTVFVPNAKCQTSATPGVLVWGDSFAMQLVPGIVKAREGEGIVQATRSSCGPLLGLAPVSGVARLNYNRKWAIECTDFNASVLQYLAQTPSIQTVVLSAALSNYLRPDWDVLRDRSELRPTNPEDALQAARRTAEAVKKLGKAVVWVAPAPAIGFDIGACRERRAMGRLTLGPNADCNVPEAQYRERNREMLAQLTRMQDEAGMPVVSFAPQLCRDGICRTEMDGESLYLDAGHLTPRASVRLVPGLALPRPPGSLENQSAP